MSRYLEINNSENSKSFIVVRHKRVSSISGVRDMAGVEIDIEGNTIVISKDEWKYLKRLINDEIKP